MKALLLLVFVLIVGGCNTIAGIADDMSSVARGTQRYMADHPTDEPNARTYRRDEVTSR